MAVQGVWLAALSSAGSAPVSGRGAGRAAGDTCPQLWFRRPEICTVECVKRSARLSAISIVVSAWLGLVGMGIASAADAYAGGYATHGHGGGPVCHQCASANHR